MSAVSGLQIEGVGLQLTNGNYVLQIKSPLLFFSKKIVHCNSNTKISHDL